MEEIVLNLEGLVPEIAPELLYIPVDFHFGFLAPSVIRASAAAQIQQYCASFATF